ILTNSAAKNSRLLAEHHPEAASKAGRDARPTEKRLLSPVGRASVPRWGRLRPRLAKDSCRTMDAGDIPVVIRAKNQEFGTPLCREERLFGRPPEQPVAIVGAQEVEPLADQVNAVAVFVADDLEGTVAFPHAAPGTKRPYYALDQRAEIQVRWRLLPQ